MREADGYRLGKQKTPEPELRVRWEDPCVAEMFRRKVLFAQVMIIDVSGVFGGDGGMGGDHVGSGPSPSDILTAALPCLKTILI
ncbi:hypothetical protein AAHC03_016453 [Spirometra sp. Aus1]